MKRLIFLLSFFILTNCFSQDTLLTENYQYTEVIVDSADLADIANTWVTILPNPTNDTTYYDVFKIILEFYPAKPLYEWYGDQIAICINNSCAFVSCDFITGPGNNVTVINALNGKHSPDVTLYGYYPLGAATTAGALRLGSILETYPTPGGGYIIVKVWHRERTIGSANN
jgi:hypothetical protein